MTTADDSLYCACFYGFKHQIIELANQNNVNYVHPPPTGDTPLYQACKQDWLDVVEMLIETYGCDPNAVTKSCESLVDMVTLILLCYSLKNMIVILIILW